MPSLVDRVSSSARTLPPADGCELQIVRSAGPYQWGDDGRRYLDTALGFGGTVLGHADPAVIEACTRALRNGPLPSWTHPGEETAAAALAAVLRPLSRVIFTNSGSEAVHLATRIARTVTGRPRIAKMAAGFDGWLDDVAFGNVTAPEAAFHDQHRPGNGRTTLLRFNDFTDVERLFDDSDDIAAVLYEPMLANAACLMPAPGYLAHVQATARRHGALLIADEVLMGFRLHNGLTSHHDGLDPDLATLGKAVASGIATAAVAGKPAVLDEFTARKGVRGGTYSGNPVACAAITATLAQLARADYPALLAQGDALRASIARSFAAAGLELSTSGYGTVFSLWHAPEPPTTYDGAERLADAERALSLHLRLRHEGVLTMPSPWGRIYTSFSHDDDAWTGLATAFAAAARHGR